MRCFQVNIRNKRCRNTLTSFNIIDHAAFFIEQECRNIDRELGDDFRGAFLARLFAQQAQIAIMTELRDYVPAWLSRIEQRRALMWSKAPDERDASNVSEFANPDYFRRRFDD